MRKLLVLLFLIPLAGCATPFGTYMKDRANDFADCFKGNIGGGIGIDAHVKATEYISTGVGGSYTRNITFKGRYTGSFEYEHYGIPILPIAQLLPSGIVATFGISAFLITDTYFEEDCPKDWPEWMKYNDGASIIFIDIMAFSEKTPLINQFDIELGGTAGVISAGIGFSPGQLVDFLLGWTGIDIAKDDTNNKKKEEK